MASQQQAAIQAAACCYRLHTERPSQARQKIHIHGVWSAQLHSIKTRRHTMQHLHFAKRDVRSLHMFWIEDLDAGLQFVHSHSGE